MVVFPYLILCLCLTINTCNSQLEKGASLDDLIADIFTKDDTTFSSTTPAPKPIIPPSADPHTVKEPTKYASCGDQKECVPRWLCANDTINTSGENIIDIRIDTGSPCKNYLDRCCDIPNKVRIFYVNKIWAMGISVSTKSFNAYFDTFF